MTLEETPETVRSALIVLLRRCADFLEKLPSDDVDALLRGELDLRLSVSTRKSPAKKPPKDVFNAARLDEVLAQLRSLESREQGEQLLKDIVPTKSILQALARQLDISVRKDERFEDLSRRIVESTIGFRLSSAAIQGKKLGRNREEPTPTKPTDSST